jgi:sodium transport system permease protein
MMRWSIIRTIWYREMRDQLRDRRTLLMIVGLPLVLYPLLGFAVLQFAVGFTEKPSVVAFVTGSPTNHDFPPREPVSAGRSLVPFLTPLAAMPMRGDNGLGAVALVNASRNLLDYSFLIEAGRFTPLDSRHANKQLRDQAQRVKIEFVEKYDERDLTERNVDLIVEAPALFFVTLESADEAPVRRPQLRIYGRKEDDRSRLAQRRLSQVMNAWTDDLKAVRLVRHGLTEQFLSPYEVILPDEAPAIAAAPIDRGGEMIIRLFPLMLVMWSLAGALYPAVDLCAGEKERGTMETLLITPAGREEIVLGKFLTIWVFSFGTALLNLLSMGATTAQFSGYLPHTVSLGAICWCVVLALPQSAFFSAVALAIGAYARSSKEGQYYLMPLFVLTMPLVFLTLAPGVELSAFYSLVPVTGVALLMQKLMTAPTIAAIPWAYFVPVLFPIGLYSWLALRWAIEQFNREEVLFREAERIDLLLWFKTLFRDKEPLPTTGQAFFVVALLIGLRWLSLGLGKRWPLEVQTIIGEVAFVAAPALLMVIMLNTRPASSLYLRWPLRRETGLAALLAFLMLPPIIGLTQMAVLWFPALREGVHPLVEIMRAIHEGRDLDSAQLVWYGMSFALVPAVCEEIAFRGFVLHGLHHGFRPRNAVLLSSIFFALFHLNVFLFVPTFILGVVLGLLTIRSRSLLPAILFHLLHNSVLIALIPLSRYSTESLPRLAQDAWAWLIGLCVVLGMALVWWLYRKPYVDLARREMAERMQKK